MKRFVTLTTILIATYILAGCGHPDVLVRSAFYTDFSIGPVVMENEAYLLDGSKPLSGSEAGPSTPPFQKYEEMIVQMDPTNEIKFMEAIQSGVESALTGSGVVIEGTGGGIHRPDPDGTPPDIMYFSYRYNQDEVTGILNVWGMHGKADNFILISVITEN